jgi:hypothetical protein
MCKSLLALCALLMLLFAGCGGKSEGEELKTTAPVDNNAPEAKSAPVAPTDPSIQYPGGVKGKK